MIENLFEKLDKLKPDDLENAGILQTARSQKLVNGFKTYVCPRCGNGNHRNDSVGITVKEFEWGYNYWCHKCGNFTGTKILLEKLGSCGEIEKWYKTEFLSFNVFYENFVRGEEKNFVTTQEKKKNSAAASTEVPPRDYSELYKKAQARLLEKMSGGIVWRGLALKDLQEVEVGVVTEEELRRYGEEVEGTVMIFPFNEHHFFMRSLEGRTKRGNKGGNKEIYDRLVDKENSSVVIAVEGIIDCLSIRKVTKLPVVAVDGAGEFRRLREWATRKFSSFNVPKFILIGDNNDSGAGQKGAAAGVEELRRGGILAVSKILSPDKKYDANEFLQKEGEEKLATRVFELVAESEEEFRKQEAEEQIKKERRELKTKPNPLSMAEVRRNGYGVMRAHLLKYYAKLKTKLASLDSKQILSAGIYLLGGVAGIGKTAFALQLAETFAAQGQTVLYVSYEQTAELLQAKILSRRLNLASGEVQNELQIYLDGDLQECIFDKLNDDATFERINFFEAETETIADLIQSIQEKFLLKGKSPIIFLDYVQKIPAMKNSDGAKEKIDASMKLLKDFQKKNDLIVFVLSSFNRENYWLPVSETAFKETGELEFTADVIFGLQYSVVNTFSKMTEFEKRDLISKAKKEQPRKIQLVCLKNRFGEPYKCNFFFHSAVNNFEEVSGSARAQMNFDDEDWEVKK